jgi:hypothetical protein
MSKFPLVVVVVYRRVAEIFATAKKEHLFPGGFYRYQQADRDYVSIC